MAVPETLGHHRAACAGAGVFAGRRGGGTGRVDGDLLSRALQPECVAKEVPVMVRDLELRAADVQDGRRLEVVTKGSPMSSGATVRSCVKDPPRDGCRRSRTDRHS